MILGRDSEIAEVERFIRMTPQRPRALILEGAAGIGKTTLWQAGVACARATGHQVLYCRADESEAQLSYAGLGDLLDFDLPELPVPQKHALDAALLRGQVEHPRPDQRAVSVAALGVLRALAATAPVLIAIDDVQWLDAPSATILSFAARRLENEPVALLLSRRAGGPRDPLGLGRSRSTMTIQRVPVGPLDLDAVTSLVRDRVGDGISHPMMLRLHQASGGNPFFALEIATALSQGTVRAEPGAPLPVPDDLKDLLRARLAAQPAPVLEMLLMIAAAGRPTKELLGAAAGVQDSSPPLTEAARAGIIELAGDRIVFTHPLLGSTVYSEATAGSRQAVHRRLADLVEDPEERARHLALAATHHDARAARALDRAAAHARSRGAPDAAADLSELAKKLTPPENAKDILRRTTDAAEHHFIAGDAMRATALLEEGIGAAARGGHRADTLFRLASISWLDIPRVQGLAEQALTEADDDAELLASIHEHLAWVGIYRGDLSFASAHARASIDKAAAVHDPAIRADYLATFGMVEFLLGRPAESHMVEAVKSQDLGAIKRGGALETIYTAARTCYGLQLLWSGRLDDARRVLRREMSDYERRGRYVVRDELHCYLAEVECRAGNWQTAAEHAREAVEIGEDSGHLKGRGSMLFPRALVAALRGEIDSARRDALEGLAISLDNEDFLSANCNRAVLGFLELSLSRPLEAMNHLEPVLTFLHTMGAAEPGVIPAAPDAIEALISLGRMDEAESLMERFERLGRDRRRPWAVAAAARCGGLLYAARGDLRAARALLDDALATLDDVPQPFERARTHLIKGDVERRAKQKRAARSSFEQALTLFETLGAPLWGLRARDGLERVSPDAVSPGELTPTERRIAELVADGLRNREVADALFISVKTVEANLSRIFHKLGVRSRTELSRSIRTP